LRDYPVQMSDYIGWTIWVVGFLLEVVADQQKFNFRKYTANQDKWIETGLFQFCRYPNYLGEIMLWIGIFLTCSASLQGVQWIAIISPIFVTFLLVKVSGIPLLEKSNAQKWNGNPSFQNYKMRTKLLIPYIY